jgi:hypothetical protein
VTRNEPCPVHITLIATFRVYSSYSSVVVIRGITPGLSGSPGYETRQAAESAFFHWQSRGTWAVAAVRLSRPRSTPC